MVAPQKGRGRVAPDPAPNKNATSKQQRELSGAAGVGANLPALRKAAREYVAKGWTLVPVRNKKPMGDDWNHATAMHDPASIERNLGPGSTANGVGVLLAKSKLCSFDADDLVRTRAALAKLGIDADAALDSGWHVKSGKHNSARALFSLPKGAPLRWLKLRRVLPREHWTVDEDGTLHRTNAIVFELRAGSDNLQDVLPPSLHDSGTTYSGPPLPRRMPVLAGPLLALWHRWQADPKTVEAELFDALGVPVEDRKPSLSGKPGKLDFPSAVRVPYNATTSVEAILQRHGYTDDGTGRYAHPGATGSPGCAPIPDKDDLWHSHNCGDDLHGTFDAWTAHVVLDHNFDQEAAERAWYAEHPKGAEFAAIEGEDDAIPEPPPRRAERQVSLHFGTNISEDNMDFLIEPFLPLGLVVGLYGGPGASKSSLAATLAAVASNGAPYPGLRNATDGPYMQGSTLWVSSEESNSWIVNRFLKAGGQSGTIVVPEVTVLERGRDMHPVRTSFDAEQDLLPAIEQANKELARKKLPPVRFVVLDTVVALVRWGDGGNKQKNPNSDEAVKNVVWALERIAREKRCCIAMVGHTNKDYRAPNAEYMVSGSKSWVSSTRLPMLAAKDPLAPGRFLLASIRNSTGPEFAAAYTLRVVHTLREMQTQRHADGTRVRSTLQAVDTFAGMAWNDAEIARLRNTFAPVEDPADAPAQHGPTKRERAIEWIVEQVSAEGFCRRADLPFDIEPSCGAEWRHVEGELSRRGLLRRKRGNAVVYVGDLLL